MTRVLVVGGGAFGSAIALVLAQSGAEVVLADASSVGDNASGVAAGMLAPAFEAVLDPPSTAHFALLKRARDQWPAFLDRLGGRDVGLTRAGAVWVDRDDGRPGRRDAIMAALTAVTADAEARADGVFTPEDWRLEPRLALASIRAAAKEAGARAVADTVEWIGDGVAHLTQGPPLSWDRLVLATGAAPNILAPELARLSPISGQILSFRGKDHGGQAPTVRFSGGYAVRSAGGLVVGATMEPGRVTDPGAVRPLLEAAHAIFPETVGVAPTIRSAVRASTPDGLPMIGPSGRKGVYLAVGARRNGWLLAPLVATMTAAYLAGVDVGDDRRAFDPARFDGSVRQDGED